MGPHFFTKKKSGYSFNMQFLKNKHRINILCHRAPWTSSGIQTPWMGEARRGLACANGSDHHISRDPMGYLYQEFLLSPNQFGIPIFRQ